MKYRVKIASQTFDVEIRDLHTSPILAIVDGETIEIWPENLPSTAPTPVSPSVASLAPATEPPPLKANGSQPAARGDTKREVRAPIPGTIVAISVNAGDHVNPGDELCILEAMKMKNLIRATRAGTVARVRIQIGQTVKHQEVLMEFTN